MIFISYYYVLYRVIFCLQITHWLSALGYSLCYGTILAKMFRVYIIFNNPNPKTKLVILLLLATTVQGIKMVTFPFRSVLSKRNMFHAVHRSVPVSHAQATN